MNLFLFVIRSNCTVQGYPAAHLNLVSTLLVTMLVRNKTDNKAELVSEIDILNEAIRCKPDNTCQGEAWKSTIFTESIEFAILALEEGADQFLPRDFRGSIKGGISKTVTKDNCNYGALVQRLQTHLTATIIATENHRSARLRKKRERVVNILSSWGRVCSHCHRKGKCDCYLGSSPTFSAGCDIIKEQSECTVGCSIAGYPAALARMVASFKQTLVNTDNGSKGDQEDISQIENTLKCPNQKEKCPLQPTGWEQVVAAAALEFARQATREGILTRLPSFTFSKLLGRIGSLNGEPAFLAPWEVRHKRCGRSSFIRLLKSDILPVLREVEKDRANSWLHGVYSRQLQDLSSIFLNALGGWSRHCTACLVHGRCLCDEPSPPNFYVDCFSNYEDIVDDEDYVDFSDSGSGDGDGSAGL